MIMGSRREKKEGEARGGGIAVQYATWVDLQKKAKVNSTNQIQEFCYMYRPNQLTRCYVRFYPIQIFWE
jgi:hypothetical protein